MIPPSFNTVHIDLQALHHNYRLLADEAGEAAFLAMVKADGYGHGMVECATALEEAGCGYFGVAELGEAVVLRQSGLNSPILAMVGFDPREAEVFCSHDITPVVYDKTSLKALSQAAERLGHHIPVHVKVDTGMRRLGVEAAGLRELLETIDSHPRLRLAGLASHFPCADDVESDSTGESLECFEQMRRIVADRPGIIYHIANSGGTLYFPESRYDMVRCGIALYGYYPEGREGATPGGLQPVMSYTSRVLQVKEIEAGCGVSYGHTWIADRTTRLAVLPVGYEDGYSRALSNRGEVLIRGRRAPIRGRVCMNLCMVDVTQIDGVSAGDEVVLLGRQGEERITADEIANHIGTINYEVLCMIGNNNQRRFPYKKRQ